MKEKGKMIRKMEEDRLEKKMEIFMKVNLKIIQLMVKDS